MSADLKEERVGETLMWEGSEFHRVGAATEKVTDYPKSGALSGRLAAGWHVGSHVGYLVPFTICLLRHIKLIILYAGL